MLLKSMYKYLRSFRDDTRGSLMVETVITLPILFWALTATYDLFELHRYKSVREKATFTIGDMISREQDYLTTTYIDNTKALFDEITNDNGVNQIRISIVKYDQNIDKYKISWSEVRGTGGLVALTDADVANAHDRIPVLDHGKEVILIESNSVFHSLFNIGLKKDLRIDTRTFTTIRFAPQICLEGGNSCVI
ncbi:hypothetical protein PEL8287_01508 [Roseovarius litorisediminis]|uniref:TadE-like protein n=1 Tax=Roseovarius litorisediminis TaxID=1312363 RepID=A0A1Y5S651_9RHOB|nr:pilus assembly protein [Roseovarius litorisediminis]SLN32152.1 hypothetical protein PEL8287_01508 [Roseovarius litorisediminis]